MTPRSERHGYIRPDNGLGWKRDFRALEARGVFGNSFRTWNSLPQAIEDGYRGYLRIGNRKASSPHKVHCVHWTGVVATVGRLLASGARGEDLFLGEVPAPDNPRLINFEAHRSPRYLELDWGTGQKPLRDDLNDRLQKPASGAQAVAILRHFLGREYDALEEIWDRWPSAAIEGSCWRSPVGILRRRLIPWEVRQY